MNIELERQAFEVHMRLGGYSNPEKHPDGSYVSSAMELWWQGWNAYAAWQRTRPAQTEQQPVCWASSAALAKLQNGRNNSPCVLTDGPAEFNDTPLYAAPIAQTAPHAAGDRHAAHRQDAGRVRGVGRQRGVRPITSPLCKG